MRLRGYPTEGELGFSYFGTPSGSIVGTLTDSSQIRFLDESGVISGVGEYGSTPSFI